MDTIVEDTVNLFNYFLSSDNTLDVLKRDFKPPSQEEMEELMEKFDNDAVGLANQKELFFHYFSNCTKP